MRVNFLLAVLATSIAGAYAISQETPRGRAAGSIVRPDGKRAANARVVLIPQAPGNTADGWYRARTDVSGDWSVAVPAGDYRVLAERGAARVEVRLTVAEAQTTHAELHLRRPRPDVPPPHPPPDPAALRKRTRDIVRARFRLSRELLDIIRKNDRSGLPLPVVLAQAGAESSFQPRLKGKLDELGLFQLRPSTARDFAGSRFTDAALLDAAVSTQLATRHMHRLKSIFGDTRTALGAYNQGQGRTMRQGLYPVAQLYADAILLAAYHPAFRNRVVQLDPSLAHYWNLKHKTPKFKTPQQKSR